MAWRQCQSSEGTSVPVEIQIQAWHSGLLFPGLLYTASVAAQTSQWPLAAKTTLIKSAAPGVFVAEN